MFLFANDSIVLGEVGACPHHEACPHTLLCAAGSASYLALKLCHKVAHNPNLDLLILPFACSRINNKLCLKMCILQKLPLCASCTYILASSTVNYAQLRSYAFSN